VGGILGGIGFILTMGMLIDGDMHPTLPPPQPNEFEIVSYSEKAPGFQNHHGILDKWQAVNIPGYLRRAPDAPTMRLSILQHDRTKEAQRAWLKAVTGREVGGTVDWRAITPREILDLSERMFDAAGVPRGARQAYYRAATEYLYRLEK
jgi:hypothetical protein